MGWDDLCRLVALPPRGSHSIRIDFEHRLCLIQVEGGRDKSLRTVGHQSDGSIAVGYHIKEAITISGFDNISETVRTVSATGSVLANDYDVLVLGATANATLTLPAVANLSPGRVFRIYKDAAAFTVTIAPAAGTIDGAANIVLAASAKHAATVLTDGTNWFTVSSY